MSSKKPAKVEPKAEPKPEVKPEEESKPHAEEPQQPPMEEKSAAQGKKQGDFLPVRSYLDQTVVPLLIQALSELAKERYDFAGGN